MKRGERAGKQCNEIPPWNFHSISSSAKESSPAVALAERLGGLEVDHKVKLEQCCRALHFSAAPVAPAIQ
jgi:hypothetical protein